MKKITVVGCGFVGLSNAFLLSINNDVVAIDKDEEKIKLLNEKKLPINDELMEKYFKKKNLNLTFDIDFKNHLDSDFIIISTPTDYNPETNSFNTSSVESILKNLNDFNYVGSIIIKSTIPIGFTEKMTKIFKNLNIIFSPEFLRETTALEDNLYPNRIIVSSSREDLKNKILEFGSLLKKSAKNDPDILTMHSSEAEAVKLFSNTYLAMRIAFFNELDTFALKTNLNPEKIINGVCKDNRIGEYYNNPSFGYGGYCLPKDTKQLLFNYKNIPNELIKAIVKSNETRKENIVVDVIKKIGEKKNIGVYRLIMKDGSDNFRSSSVLDIIKKLEEKGFNIIIHEPNIKKDKKFNFKIENDLEKFKKDSDLILCNRIHNKLKSVKYKVYTRDIYNSDK